MAEIVFFKNQQFASYDDFLKKKEEYESNTGYEIKTGDSSENPNYNPDDPINNKFPYKYKVWKCPRSGKNDAKKRTTIEKTDCQFKLRLTLPKKEEGKEQGKMKISILHLTHNHLLEHDIPGVNEPRVAQVETILLENNAEKHEQATIDKENVKAGCTGPSKAVSAEAVNDQKEKEEAKKQLETVMTLTSLDIVAQSKNVLHEINGKNLAAIEDNIYNEKADCIELSEAVTKEAVNDRAEKRETKKQVTEMNEDVLDDFSNASVETVSSEKSLNSSMRGINLECKSLDKIYDENKTEVSEQNKGAVKKLLVGSNSDKVDNQDTFKSNIVETNLEFEKCNKTMNEEKCELEKDDAMKSKTRERGRPRGAVTTAIGLPIKKRIIKFEKLTLKQKLYKILSWLNLDANLVTLITKQECILVYEMIEVYLPSLPDAFLCDEINSMILSTLLTARLCAT